LSAIIPQVPALGYNVNENIIGGIVQNNVLFSGGADWKLPWIEIRYIGSYQKVLATYANYDYDGSPLPLVSFRPEGEFGDQRTHELQFLSTPETPFSKYFSFVSGFYFLDGQGGFPTLALDVGGPGGLPTGLLSQVSGTQGLVAGLNGFLAGLNQPSLSALNGPITAISGGLLSTRSLSAYFQGTVHIQDLLSLPNQLNLILGARLDKETRGLEGNYFGALNPLNRNQRIIFANFSVPDVSAVQVPLKVGLQWYPWDLTQLYATFGRGFTAPTYNTVNFFSAPDQLKPQRVDSYELGVKTQLFDDTLTLNTAIFDIKEYELLTAFASVTSGGVVRFDNAPSAGIKGAEFDFTWQALPQLDSGLVLIGSFSYLHARYTDYPNARGYDVATGLSYGDGAPLPGRNVTGNSIARTPTISYNVGINQNLQLSDATRLEFAVESNWSAKFFYDPANTPEYANNSFRLVDARASYFYTPLGLEITAYGKNLTRELYKASVFMLDPGEMVSPNDPRVFGLRLKYSY
jgi:iron complex outermembrane receptor protein